VAERNEPPVVEGEVLLIDKPAGWTSFDVVNKIRRLSGGVKTGHAGTLDPMATGLLIVCTGRRRKQIDSYMGLDKEYEVEMELGVRTPSFDAETAVTERRSTAGITETQVREILAGFAGPQTQVPPMWSAVKIDGTRLYKLARKGVEVDRPPRQVVIHQIAATEIQLPKVRFTVVCSKGTYVRAIVNDAGERLGCGACMTALRRTRIGPYGIGEAITIEQFQRRVAASAEPAPLA
jgi:tRNA pseudouridine55 synthase